MKEHIQILDEYCKSKNMNDRALPASRIKYSNVVEQCASINKGEKQKWIFDEHYSAHSDLVQHLTTKEP
jgi:Leu/Phe-tRNA-protein transferase